MPARPFGEDAERALACVFVGPVGLEPTTYGVLVGPSLVTLKVALTCMFVGAWLWLFLPAQPPRCPARCPVWGPSRSGVTGRVCAVTAKAERSVVTGCDVGTEAHSMGSKRRPIAVVTAGAYGSQARADPCRPQRSRRR